MCENPEINIFSCHHIDNIETFWRVCVCVYVCGGWGGGGWGWGGGGWGVGVGGGGGGSGVGGWRGGGGDVYTNFFLETSLGTPGWGLSQYKDVVLQVYGSPCYRYLIFNIGIPIPGKDGLYIETGPWSFGHRHAYLSTVKLPWIIRESPLDFNGAPGNIQGNLTGMDT